MRYRVAREVTTTSKTGQIYRPKTSALLAARVSDTSVRSCRSATESSVSDMRASSDFTREQTPE